MLVCLSSALAMNVSLRSCEVVSTLSICRCLRGTLALPLPRSHKRLSQSVKQQQTLTARATFFDTAWSTTLNPEVRLKSPCDGRYAT